MCRGRGAVVFCPGGRLVFQRSWGGSESEEPAERNLASVSCHRWLLSESARISLCVVSTRRAGAGFPQTQLSVEQASRRWRVIRRGPVRVELVARPQHRRVLGRRHRRRQRPGLARVADHAALERAQLLERGERVLARRELSRRRQRLAATPGTRGTRCNGRHQAELLERRRPVWTVSSTSAPSSRSQRENVARITRPHSKGWENTTKAKR